MTPPWTLREDKVSPTLQPSFAERGWVVLSGSVGVFIFKRNELLDDEPPTPREEYDPSEPLAESTTPPSPLRISMNQLYAHSPTEYLRIRIQLIQRLMA